VNDTSRSGSLDALADGPLPKAECKTLGTKSGLPKIITTMRQALNLGSFFTTGEDEVLTERRVVVHDSLNEGLLEVGVNDTSRSGSLDALAD
jgi:hypothetical protein